MLEKRCMVGDIWQLGKHRLIVGDSTQEETYARLFAGERSTMVVTSPPYAAQRDYGTDEFDWNELMFSMFCCMTAYVEEDAHVLINLGLVHRNRTVDRYWDAFLAYCEFLEWPLFGWYVWDKGEGLPGDWSGRLAPAHEFIFHFNKRRNTPNKWIATKERAARFRRNVLRRRDGGYDEAKNPATFGQPFKIPNSVIRINSEHGRGIHTEQHPAVYPVALPAFVMRTWSKEDDIICDPFCGSGTTLLAAEQEQRICYAIEIYEHYADLILARWEEKTRIPALLLERVKIAGGKL